MAELGPIDFQQTSGTTREVDEFGPAGQAIAGAVNAFVQARNDDILGDFREDSLALIDEAREGALTSTVFEGASNLEGEPGRIQRRVRGLYAQQERGNQSQRTLAEIELKKLLNDTQARYPGLARELQQQYGMIVSANHKLDEIGLIDQISAEQGKMAAQQYNDMIDWAYLDVKDGGLGIDKSLDPRTDEFARQFNERSKIRNLQQAHEMDLVLAQTTADMSARSKLNAVTNAIQSQGNLIDQDMDRNIELLTRYRMEVNKPSDQRDLEFMDNFSSNLRPAMIEEQELKKTMVMSILNDSFPTADERASESYTMALAVAEDEIARIDGFINALNTEDRAAIDHAIMAQRIKNMQMRQQNGSYNNFLTFADPEAEGFLPLLDVFSKMDLSGGGVILGQSVSNTGLRSISDILNIASAADAGAAIFHSAGQGTVDNQTSAPQIQARLRANWSGNEGFYGIANSTEEEDIERSVAHLELMRRASAQAVATKSPYTAGVFMTDATNALMVMSALGNPERTQIQATTSILSDPNILEAALLDGNGENKQRRLALGNAAAEFYTEVEPAKQMLAIQNSLAQPYMGAPLKNYVQFATTKDEENPQFSFSVDSGYLKSQLEANSIGGIGQSQIAAHTRRIKDMVEPQIARINEHIRANAHIDALQQDVIDRTQADYLNMADQLGWLDYLMGE